MVKLKKSYAGLRVMSAVLFDGSFDGLLCVIYAYYYEKLMPSRIEFERVFQSAIGEDAVVVTTEPNKARQVLEAVRQKISEEALEAAYGAYLCEDNNTLQGKWVSIFRYIILGFKVGNAVYRYENEDCVRHVRSMASKTFRESHLLKGFVRFKETKNGFLFSEISPTNNVLTLLAEHFSDRLKLEHWVIFDKSRHIAAVYNADTFEIREVGEVLPVEMTELEAYYEKLFVTFFNTITIENRVNPKLQTQLLPKKFRKNMPEFTLPDSFEK